MIIIRILNEGSMCGSLFEKEKTQNTYKHIHQSKYTIEIFSFSSSPLDIYEFSFIIVRNKILKNTGHHQKYGRLKWINLETKNTDTEEL